ncbi:Xenotropic and polytropic retrovirus receptor 1 [Lithohypha guttulata]|uniref:Xenotropic and polytropic retrovirus receptor 1 n=1 Tax=Lithohypha guttulata TaxID=1690604 RepID=A0AAN7T6G2_9EURO|nr:Xenotropic and polytropic retrovirus receptor 1 [Lithohypha guttulata]
MKFAKELEDDLVPEWRAKYINYKQGKKKIKEISKALRSASRTPKTPGKPQLPHFDSTASIPYTHYDFEARAQREANNGKTPQNMFAQKGHTRAGMQAQYANMRKMSTTMFSTSPPIRAPDAAADSDSEEGSDLSDVEDEESTPLKKAVTGKSITETPASYGSFSPPGRTDPTQSAENAQQSGRMPKLALPDPALDPGKERTHTPPGIPFEQQRSASDFQSTPPSQNAQRPETKKHNSHPLLRSIVQRKMDQSQQGPQDGAPATKLSARERFKRAFSAKQINTPEMPSVQQEAYVELDRRQDDFFSFLDKELDKVEKFYQQKEDEARDRLGALRAQLHEHRDQRARDMRLEREGRLHHPQREGQFAEILAETDLHQNSAGKDFQNGALFKKVFKNEPKVGKTSRAMENMATPPGSPGTKAQQDKKDYTKKKTDKVNERVPYRFAKRRLKLAMQEFYRGMELLKSYALLNRTGFRKINKKYDKAVNARPPLRYLNEKVANAHFVKSTLIDEFLVTIEDLYARYFERGNRKVAVSKLRSRLQQGDHSPSAFRNGLFLAAGAGFGVAGLYNGLDILYNGDPAIKTVTSYLLQMYAGYFLALLLFLMFVLDCKIWTMARINYTFVFEYDTRSVLDWRQLAEIPCFFAFLLGLTVWCNFAFGMHYMYHWWPIVLFGLTVLIMFLPYKIFYYHSRVWWAYSNYRLIFAGIFPVEFRDFFLGDMYCSLTYFMSQLEVFFCVYRWNWQNPSRCSSSHSMLLGFLTTLPAIWRFAQCVRRYLDSGNKFPHLANCAKYMGNILYYMTLSLYRIHIGTEQKTKYKIAFIVFAGLNAIYCSIWDVFMDWSLGNFFVKHRGLRGTLAFRKQWVYWLAILENTVLRHQWIFYAVFAEDLQHSSAVSFFVALAEVGRRGIWTLFRVENEHTNNVKQFRASRDIPLPYSLNVSPKAEEQEQDSPKVRRRKADKDDGTPQTQGRDSGTATGAETDLERQSTNDSSSTLRSRMTTTPALRALHRVGTVIAAAHAQDFQKKKRLELGTSPDDTPMVNRGRQYDSEDDDDEEDDKHDIEGSEFDDTEAAEYKNRSRGQDNDQDKENAQRESDDGGEGSSGESHTHEHTEDVDIENKDDVDEARELAIKYRADEGLRGSSSSKDK